MFAVVPSRSDKADDEAENGRAARNCPWLVDEHASAVPLPFSTRRLETGLQPNTALVRTRDTERRRRRRAPTLLLTLPRVGWLSEARETQWATPHAKASTPTSCVGTHGQGGQGPGAREQRAWDLGLPG